jgi:hypothetical protein
MKHWHPILLFLFEVIVVLPRLNYMNWLKPKKKHYIIRLKANAILQSKAQAIADENLDGTLLDKSQVYYAERNGDLPPMSPHIFHLMEL